MRRSIENGTASNSWVLTSVFMGPNMGIRIRPNNTRLSSNKEKNGGKSVLKCEQNIYNRTEKILLTVNESNYNSNYQNISTTLARYLKIHNQQNK